MPILYLLEDNGSCDRDPKVKYQSCQNQLYRSHVFCFVRYSETNKVLLNTDRFAERTGLHVTLYNSLREVHGSNVGRDTGYPD
jgi:hypothetical protein